MKSFPSVPCLPFPQVPPGSAIRKVDPVHFRSGSEAGNAATWQATGHSIPPGLLDECGQGSPVEGLVDDKWQGKAARLSFHDVLQMVKVGKGGRFGSLD